MSELTRIRRAYERYDTDKVEARRRDPKNAGLQMLVGEWRDRLAERLSAERLPGPETRVLDIGCGNGALLEWFVQLGARERNCHGVELLPARVRDSQARLPHAAFHCGSADKLPFPDESFDLVSMSLVVTSVKDDALARDICLEATRTLAPGGIIVWYDTRLPNPFNRDVRKVSERELRKLFPGFEASLEPISLIPPIARALGRTAPRLYPALAQLSWLKARYLALLWRA